MVDSSRQDLYVIRKEKASVVVWTAQFRMEGMVHFVPKARVSDLLNRQDITFIPMTEVTVYDLNGMELLKTDFLAVNKQQIMMLTVDV